jgi:hypothetical protein
MTSKLLKIDVEKVNELKANFREIINYRNEIKNTFENLEQKIFKLKEIYNNFIKNKNNTKNIFLFGLDSLYFQSKLIDIELEHMKSYYKLINNRAYSSYYKLLKIIDIYLKKNLPDKKILDILDNMVNIPVYKDLEPYKEYDFELTLLIHNTIIELIFSMNNLLSGKNIELINYEESKHLGLNIDNFIASFEHENLSIKNEASLYVSYMDFLFNLNCGYYNRFLTKIKILLGQVEHDVKFENKKSKKNTITNLINDNIDENLIKEIKLSISSSIDHSESKNQNYESDTDINTSENINNEVFTNEIIINNETKKKTKKGKK